ncbi:uncharacterized protein LOC110448384 [Mizuhopecten yessoensis]|uniref:uncharacterized protein LOC110448384 n=1 Tax=Mizuhopecten yessoensis TaxID=6573 RepID=UPI000B45C472|nr:uncharacterized protein LOC110448384 [Mizuhopecten yessoensis]
MAQCMLGPRATLQDLCDHIDGHNLILPGWQITAIQEKAMVEMCKVLHITVPNRFCLSPINSPAALVHWRCLTVIAGALSPATMDSLRGTYAQPIHQTVHASEAPSASSSKEEVEERTTGVWNNEEQVGEEPEMQGDSMEGMQTVVYAFDSHFHLDRTRYRLRLEANASVKDVQEVMATESGDYLVQVSGGVVVYCDPPTYPSEEEINELVQDGFRVVVGVHPKIIAAPQAIEHLTWLLTLPGVAGLGEIGIDHTVDQHDQWHD